MLNLDLTMNLEITPCNEINYMAIEPRHVRAMSYQDFHQLLDELEDNNYHSQYVLLRALRMGTAEQIEEARTIYRDHEQVGHLSDETGERRRKLSEQISRVVVVREAKPSTPGSAMFGVQVYNPLEVGIKGGPLMVSAEDYNRVASNLADALSLALQHVPIDSEDERQIIAHEKAATLGHVSAAPEGSHTFELHISGCTYAQALEVLAERLGHDEDCGFPYAIKFGFPLPGNDRRAD